MSWGEDVIEYRFELRCRCGYGWVQVTPAPQVKVKACPSCGGTTAIWLTMATVIGAIMIRNEQERKVAV